VWELPNSKAPAPAKPIFINKSPKGTKSFQRAFDLRKERDELASAWAWQKQIKITPSMMAFLGQIQASCFECCERSYNRFYFRNMDNNFARAFIQPTQ